MSIPARLVFGKEVIALADKYDFSVLSTDTKCCGLEEFGKLYPDREFSIGIAEQNLFASASGFAGCNQKVVVATFAVFASMRACEQIRSFICYPDLNVLIIATHGGLLTGSDGATHIATEDIGILRCVPNLTIVEPSDEIAAKKLAPLALEFRGPLYVRFPKDATPVIHDNKKYQMVIGKAVEIVNYGSDAVLFGTGAMLHKTIQAAHILKESGINVTVIEIHTIKPIDKEAIISAAERTDNVFTVEDHSIIGGLGSAVCEVLSEHCPKRVIRIGVRDNFGESGDAQLQYEKNKMNVSDIVREVTLCKDAGKF